MAMSTPFQRQPEEYGTQVLGEVVRIFAEVGTAIGLPAMILTPINSDAARFYARLGFEAYERGSRMFLPLQTAVATIAAAANEIEQEDMEAL